MSIQLGKYENALAYEILINREYRILDDIISDSKTIFDIGGHFGFFTLYILLIKSGFYKDGIIENISKIYEIIDILEAKLGIQVHFFEPVSSYFVQAKSLLSKFEDNIIFNNIGILNKNGTSDIIKAPISSHTSLYGSNLNKGGYFQKVNFIKIDDYIYKNGIEKIDLLKLDIEGSEFNVLLDLNNDFFKKVKVLFFEYHILNDDLSQKFTILIKKLEFIYANVLIKESKYSNNIGYIFCY